MTHAKTQDTCHLGGSKIGCGPNKLKTGQVLAAIDKYLEQAGTGKSKLLSAVIYITDMRLFQQMNEVWDAWVDPDNTAARATCFVRSRSSPSTRS